MKRLAAILVALGIAGGVIGFAATPKHSGPDTAGSSWATPIGVSHLPIDLSHLPLGL